MKAPPTWSLYAEFIAHPGAEQRVATLVTQLTRDVRTERGCIRFEPFVRADNRRHWVVFEEYLDENAFREHVHSAHSVAFNEAIGPWVENGRSTLSGLIGCDIAAIRGAD